MAENRALNRRVQPLLEKLGLSRNEVKCYLASFSAPSATVSEIARGARVNRVNAYGALRRLVQRGLIEQESTTQGVKMHAAPLSRLLQLARDNQQETSKLRWKIEDIIPQLEQMATGSADAPSVVMGDVLFLRGADVFERVLGRSLEAPEGSTNCYMQAFDYFRSSDDLTYDEEYYIPRRLKKHIKARVLYRYDEYAQKLRTNDARELRETRFLPPGINAMNYLLIYGSEATLLWKDDEEVFGIIIRGGPLYDFLKMLFDIVWQIAGVNEKKKK